MRSTALYGVLLLLVALAEPGRGQAVPVPDEAELLAAPVVRETVRQPEPYTYVEEMPTLNGKSEIREITAAVQRKVTYPAAARRDSVEGEVLVSFVVETNGQVTSQRIVRGLGSGCDEAVLAAVSGLPRFQPGRQSGCTVRVQLQLPIHFVLDPVGHPLNLFPAGLNGRLLQAFQLAGQPPVCELLLDTAQRIKFSRKLLFLERIDR